MICIEYILGAHRLIYVISSFQFMLFHVMTFVSLVVHQKVNRLLRDAQRDPNNVMVEHKVPRQHTLVHSILGSRYLFQ